MQIDKAKLMSGLEEARRRLFDDPDAVGDSVQTEEGNGDVDIPAGPMRDAPRNTGSEIDSLRTQLRNLDLQHQVLAQEMMSLRETVQAVSNARGSARAGGSF